MKLAISRKNLWDKAPPAVRRFVGLALRPIPPAYLMGGTFRRHLRSVAQQYTCAAKYHHQASDRVLC